MVNKFLTSGYYLLVSARPRQWLKNLAVFAAIFFSGRLLNSFDFVEVTSTFVIFCGLSSSMYLLNDVIDIAADQVHFSKQNRPIAKGLLSKRLALICSFLLILIGLLAALSLSKILFFTALAFILIQVSYSLWLKEAILIDVIAIAFSFMLRIFAGSFVITEPLSSWLVLTVMMLSLFLAIGKRRSEVTLLTHQQAAAHRHTLTNYPIVLLDGLVFMMATATLITYSLFTFNYSSLGSKSLITNFVPTTLANSKWLMLTIPIVVYGIFRYLYLIFEKKEGESPEKVLLNDQPLFWTVALWILLTFLITYLFHF